MQQRVPQFRLRSLTGLFLVSSFSLIVWLVIAYGIAQLQHTSRNPCAQPNQPSAQACPANER